MKERARMNSFWRGFEKNAEQPIFKKIDDSSVRADLTKMWAQVIDNSEAAKRTERNTAETVPHADNYFNDISNRIPKNWRLLKGRQRGT